MNIEKLKIKLENIKANKDLYRFDFNSSYDDCYCLIKSIRCWEVFYVERGEKKLTVQFEYEFQACDYLYGVISRVLDD